MPSLCRAPSHHKMQDHPAKTACKRGIATHLCMTTCQFFRRTITSEQKHAAFLCAFAVTLRARVWVEMRHPSGGQVTPESPSVRGCGLKSKRKELLPEENMSPSVRGCGLKSSVEGIARVADFVTLRARVWVEMCQVVISSP